MRLGSWIITVCFLLALCLSFGVANAQAPATTVTSDLDRPIRACENQVASWRHEAYLEIALVVAVIIFGATISAVQKSKGKWATRSTVVLGVLTAILTAVNSRVFSADDRTLRRAAFEGDSVIGQLWVAADSMKQASSQQDRETFKAEYLKKLLEFQSIGEKLNGTSQTQGGTEVASEFDIVPSVYAQSKAQIPTWVGNPPSDNTSLYFVGKASDPSIANAKQSSFEDAAHSGAVELRRQAPSKSELALFELVKTSAVVVDSAFTRDAKSGSYTYFTLLRISREVQGVGIKSLPSANNTQPATTIKAKDWRPGDLALNATSGMFVLDSDGRVSRLSTGLQDTARVEKIFRLERVYFGIAVAASTDSVYVAANSKLGCSVFRYSLATKAVGRRLVAPLEDCGGIATDGTAIYVTLSRRNEVRWWDSWSGQTSHSWSLAESSSPGYITFDSIGHRLIVADAAGRAYTIELSDGKSQLLSSNLGYVTSMATSRFYVLVASGNKVLFLARSDGRGVNPPDSARTLTGGHIVGVAVDESDRMWYADYDNKCVRGPVPLT